MSQYDFGTMNAAAISGTGLVAALNSFRDALLTQHSGTSRPTYIKTNQIWLDTTTAAAPILKLYDGSADITLGTLDYTNHFWKPNEATHMAASTLASAATTDLGSVDTLLVNITGTTTITSLGTKANAVKFVQFSGSLTLTHNGTSLNLPGAQNIQTSAGDTAIFVSGGGGNWRCYTYHCAAGLQGLGFGKNAIINGDFAIAQRGTTFNTPANNAYTFDRWYVAYDGTIGTFSVNQNVFSPGTIVNGRERKYFMNWNQSVAGSGSTFRQFSQKIKDVRTFANQQVTLSFWAYADAARNIQASLIRVYGSGGSPSAADVGAASGTIALTTTAQRFVIPLTLPSLAGKTIGTNDDDSLQLTFSLPLNTTMTINLWDVQLELGPVATEYERKSFEQSLLDCLPYYEKSFGYTTAPAQNVGAASGEFQAPAAVGASTANNAMFQVKYRQRKRGTPTVTLYNPAAANAQARNETLNTDCTATAVANSTKEGFTVGATTPASTVAGNLMGLHWDSSAEL